MSSFMSVAPTLANALGKRRWKSSSALTESGDLIWFRLSFKEKVEHDALYDLAEQIGFRVEEIKEEYGVFSYSFKKNINKN